MRKRELKNMEWGLLIIAIILTLIGLVALFSATQETEYDDFKKQCIWAVASIVIMLIVMCIDYELLVKFSPFFYGIFVILLIAVLFTEPINGATSWFDIGSFSLQPGEFAKISVILFLAFIIGKIQIKSKSNINKPTRIMLILLVLAVPVLLIVKKPDYGTACAFIIGTAFMIYTTGIDKKYIISTLLIVIITVPLLYLFVLPEHAKKRIDIFLNPETDPRGARI